MNTAREPLTPIQAYEVRVRGAKEMSTPDLMQELGLCIMLPFSFDSDWAEVLFEEVKSRFADVSD